MRLKGEGAAAKLDGTREETSSETREGWPDTKEVEALAATLNHSAERVQTLWFSFLTFMLYLAIATGSTTDRKRQGRNAKFLSLMAFITLVLAPVILLLLLENWFLTYHSWRITWWHRFLLAVDLGLVWILWPAYRSTWGFVRFQPKKSWRLVLPGVLSAAALAFAVAMARFPDEPVRLFWPFENAAPYSYFNACRGGSGRR